MQSISVKFEKTSPLKECIGHLTFGSHRGGFSISCTILPSANGSLSAADVQSFLSILSGLGTLPITPLEVPTHLKATTHLK